MNSLKLHTLATVAAIVAACAVVSTPVLAAGAPQAAAHEHEAGMPARLSLDHGRKWATDDALRAGMGRIKALVEPKLGAAHAGKLTPAEYAALAGQIETEVGGIVTNCKLEPKSDAMLHKVIGEIGAGTDAMAGKAAKQGPQQGLVQVATAVNHYGQYFDHPQFKPIRVGH